jgi:hypothetical protein
MRKGCSIAVLTEGGVLGRDGNIYLTWRGDLLTALHSLFLLLKFLLPWTHSKGLQLQTARTRTRKQQFWSKWSAISGKEIAWWKLYMRLSVCGCFRNEFYLEICLERFSKRCVEYLCEISILWEKKLCDWCVGFTSTVRLVLNLKIRAEVAALDLRRYQK